MTLMKKGKVRLLNIVAGNSTGFWTSFAAGDSAEATDSAQTALTGEQFRDTVLSTTTTGAGINVSFQGYLDTTDVTSGSTLREVGLFTDSVSGGVMLVRQTRAGIDKDTTFTMDQNYKMTCVREP